jgi:hypothetical protein
MRGLRKRAVRNSQGTVLKSEKATEVAILQALVIT